MSDILDALRKAELQRGRSAVPGISTRQRYFSMTTARSWRWWQLLSIASVIGVSVAGGIAVYLSIDDRAENPEQTSMVEPPRPQSSSQLNQVVSGAHQQQRPDVVNTRTGGAASVTNKRQAPLKVPGPRSQVQSRTSVAAEEKVPSVSSPADSEDGSQTQPKTPPDKNQPGSSIPESEIEVANADVKDATEKEPQKRSNPTPHAERTIYNHVPSASNPLNQIRPPLAVEVPRFNPKISPPQAAAKKSQHGVEPPLLSTLSYQFQSTVPKLTVNAQVYSKIANQRFVVINMKRYNEGQHTAEGVAVEAIRQEDIVLSYQGQRFRIQR